MTSTAQTRNSTVATVPTAALTGFSGTLIEVEAATRAGLPSLVIVGMGNKSIDEARQRVRSAITHSHLEFPLRRVTVNLAPAELPKDGAHFDLPIAVSILVASGQLTAANCSGSLFAGELALDGHLRPIKGALIITEAAKRAGYARIFMPVGNILQAQLIAGIQIIGVTSLIELFQHLKGIKPIASPATLPLAVPSGAAEPHLPSDPAHTPLTIDAIRGHDQAKRALVIAAAGRHNLLFSGPPGTGKTLLAKTLIGLLPSLSPSEVLEVTKLHSLGIASSTSVQAAPPLRAPHHSVTLTALIGGGLKPRPGDISLAHKGVLLLDELPEYPRSTLEALRQPLEDRSITLSRLYGSITYPADALLVATMNPCPCGYLGDPYTACTCSSSQITAYQKRISGPLLDRIDIRMEVSKSKHEHFFDTQTMNNTQHIKVLKSISIARKVQQKRYKRRGFYNAYASIRQVNELFGVTDEAKQLLEKATAALALSTRGILRIVRVARTIADLEGSTALQKQHLAEALQYRGSPMPS